jgi:N-acetylglucosamine kinase-like BadF-type ATPase
MGPTPTPRPGEPAPGRLIAGFDAGQTHTRCRLAWVGADGRRRPLAEGEAGGVSHLAAPGGPERFMAALEDSLAAARAALVASGSASAAALPLAAAAIGASGIEHGSAVQRQGLNLAAAALGLPLERLAVTGDERTALGGAFPRGSGILVISGTGCIALGRDGAGRTHRCGGWGWLLDGAGSAMDLGRDGLALSVQMADGRLPETPLRARLWQALGAEDAQAVKAAVVDPGFGPAGFARLAPLLDQLAASGDPHARRILARSAEALAELVGGVAAALGLEHPPVCAVGGAVTHLAQLRQGFAEQLARRLPAARLVPPAGDACDGALALAAERLRD